MSNVPHSLYFIGIGGIGMSGLARYFKARGHQVAGYDRTPSAITDKLQEEGIDVHFQEDPATIPSHFRDTPITAILVVRTPAVPLDSPLLKYWMDRRGRIVKRSVLLGMVTRNGRTVAVAGTHGKTTVSTMLSHLLHEGGIPFNAFLGGISVNYGTNVLLDQQAVVNVVEADEFDRSFLQLLPNELIVTSMDADHLDIYHDAESMREAYHTLACLCTGRLEVHQDLLGAFEGIGDTRGYAIDGGSDRAENVRVADGTYEFDLDLGGTKVQGIRSGMPGRHNVENAIAASAMALHLGVAAPAIRSGLASFRGVGRRFEVHVNEANAVYVDDYAHHPAELEAFVRSARELYPGRRITGIFQPHLFSRTRDLAADFAKALALLDELILLEIYPAREEPLPGITSQWLLDQVKMEHKSLCTISDLGAAIDRTGPDVLLSMGAGDIDRQVPMLRSKMQQRAKR